MPPAIPRAGFGFMCFLTMFTFCTITLSMSGSTRTTWPRRPLSLPAMTITSSPFLILRITASRLQHFWRQRDDSHEALVTQLAGNRAKHAGADGLQLVVQQHGGVAVEANHRTVRPAHTLAGTHDDRVVDLALLDSAARNRVLHTDFDDVANVGITPARAAKHLDALQQASAAVVCRVEDCLHLNHGDVLPCLAIVTRRSLTRGPFHNFDHAPRLGLGQRPALGDGYDIALVAGIVLVMRMHLGRTAQELAVERVHHHALDRDGDRFVHLVADHTAGQGPGSLLLFAHDDLPAFFSLITVLIRAISRRTLRS